MSSPSFFYGAQKGLQFGRRWKELEHCVVQLEEKIKEREKDELDTLAIRLAPQIRMLVQRVKDEWDDLEYLLENEEDVNRDTEFEASLYRLNVYDQMYQDLKRVHKLRC
jgi:hypothetical protein